MVLNVEPGNEKWIEWAQRKLGELSRLRVQLGLPKLVKAFVPEGGVLVWVMASRFGDWIRITGGDLYYFLTTTISEECECDGDQLDTAMVDFTSVEQIEDGYTVRGTVTAAQVYNNELVWTGTQLASSYTRTSTTVPGAGGIPVQGGTLVITGLLVLPLPSNPSNPTDGFSLDGTLLYLTPTDSFTREALAALVGVSVDLIVYIPSGVEYNIGGTPPVTTVVETFVKWFESENVLRNGTKTTVSGVPDDDTTTESFVTAFGAYPGPLPNTCAFPPELRRTDVVTFQDDGPYDGYELAQVRQSELYLDEFLSGPSVPSSSTLLVSGTFSTFNTNFPGADMVANQVASSWNTTPTFSGAHLNSNSVIVGFDHNRTETGPPAAIFDSNGFDPDETYVLVQGGDVSVFTQFPPWGGPAGSFADWSGVLIPSGMKEANARYLAAGGITQACAQQAAARLAAQLDTDPLARNTFWRTVISIGVPKTIQPTEMTVDSYPLEFRVGPEWSSFPGSPIDRVRVAERHSEGIFPPAAFSGGSSDYAAGEVSVVTAPSNLVYLVRDTALRDAATTQRDTFLALVESSDGVDNMSDANKIKSLFYKIPPDLQGS